MGFRNRVFLQKYFIAARRFGKKPGFFVGVRPGLYILFLIETESDLVTC